MIYSQENNDKRRQQILQQEQLISDYINNNSISESEISRFIDTYNNDEHSSNFDKLSISEQNANLLNHKQAFLRHQYFIDNPKARLVYRTDSAPVCTNGGFEQATSSGLNTAFSNTYMGFTSVHLQGECNMIPENNSLDGLEWTPAIDLTMNNNEFAIVSEGPDPVVGAELNMVNNGEYAVRINSKVCSNPSPNRGVNGLVKLVTLQQSGIQNIRFSYALVAESPNHDADSQNPFFVARALDSNGIELDRICVISNPMDNSFFNELNNNNCEAAVSILWQDWTCGVLTVNGNVGDEIILEFIAADCGKTGHYSYAYVDDICANTCDEGDDFQGSIELSPNDYSCDDFHLEICGEFTLPNLNGDVGTINSLSLDILNNGSVVNTLTTPMITGNTFCFLVNEADFPTSNVGYDFQANIIFDIGNGTQSASDTHTNPGQNNDYIFNSPECCNDEPYIEPFWAQCASNNVCELDSWPVHVLDGNGNPLLLIDGYTFLWSNGSTSDVLYGVVVEQEIWVEVTYPDGCVYTINYMKDCCEDAVFVIFDDCPSTTVLSNIERGYRNHDERRTVVSKADKRNAIITYRNLANNNNKDDDCDPCVTGIGVVTIVDENNNVISNYDSITVTDNSTGIEIPINQTQFTVYVDTSYTVEVVVTDANGHVCTYTYDFEYECETSTCDNLATPTNLQVISPTILNPVTTLSWDPVPGATGYIVSSPSIINVNCGNVGLISLAATSVNTNSLQISLGTSKRCFVWQVKAICKNYSSSNSQQECYYGCKPDKIYKDKKRIRKVSILPNPSKGNVEFSIQSDMDSNVILEVYNFYGNRVYSTTIKMSSKESETINWNATHLEKGIYFVRIKSNNEIINKQLILK